MCFSVVYTGQNWPVRGNPLFPFEYCGTDRNRGTGDSVPQRYGEPGNRENRGTGIIGSFGKIGKIGSSGSLINEDIRIHNSRLDISEEVKRLPYRD